jgi:hypothetical protein
MEALAKAGHVVEPFNGMQGPAMATGTAKDQAKGKER